MATISKLVVSLSANSAKLVSELAKSQRSVGKWAADVRKKAATVAKVMTAAGVAAVGAIAAIVNAQAGEIDKLAKAASALDIDTSALQRLRYQAELSGVGVDKMDQSLKRMLRSVSDAKDGTGAAAEAFQKLGINANNLSGLSADRQFAAIAEAMKGITNQADKTAIAMDIFGRSGGDLVNTLSSDLQGVGAEFDKLGISISSQQAAMVEAYNDSKSKMSTIWNGFINHVAVAVAPAFQEVIEYLIKTTEHAGGMGNVATSALEKVAGGLAVIQDAFRLVTAFGAKSYQGIVKLSAVMLEAFRSIENAYISMASLLGQEIKPSASLKKWAEAEKEQVGRVQHAIDNLVDTESNQTRVKKYFDDLRARTAEAASGGNDGAGKGGSDTEKKTLTFEEKIAAAAAKRDELNQKLIVSQEKVITTTDKTAESAGKLGTALDKTASGMSDLYKQLFGDPDKKKTEEEKAKADFKAKPQQIRDINFESYAKAAKAASDRGDSSSFDRFIAAASDQSSRARGSTFSYDNAGQRDVLNRLTGGNVEKIGTVEFIVNGTSVGLTGEPGRIKTFTDDLTKALNNEASTLAIA